MDVDEFRLVKLSDLVPPSTRGLLGKRPGPPNVRLTKTGNLNFSKMAAVPLAEFPIAIVEYHEGLHTIKFIGTDKLPQGFTQDDCCLIGRPKAKNGKQAANRVIAIKRLFRALRFESEIENGMNVEIADMCEPEHSVSIVVPLVLRRQEHLPGLGTAASFGDFMTTNHPDLARS